ncbi:MAG: hypothetical protein A2X35_06760 [Elusimicrobia bacterium GWA2_61_42]|nr:MAG: hypothetical protein A2X35_06760 [Elusimicrobia bacterium GWA2_61_42]OGR79790.1 MAG: hypothetical protein A2X38_12555 [Elusimicrobia bacterium GWC2_61_25]
MIKTKVITLIAFMLFAAGSAFAAKPAPAIDGFAALDMPYDVGNAAVLRWPANPADTDDTSYVVYVSTHETGGWLEADRFAAAAKTGKDIELPFWAWNGSAAEHAVKIELNNLFGESLPSSVFQFRVTAEKNKKVIAESAVVSVMPVGNWFRLDRLNNLILLIVLIIIFFWAVSHAKRKGLFIRRIAGLDAIDEAIGRATEMGKPIFYVPGIGSMGSISTIASAFILGEVSKKVAQYDSQIKVPHYDPIVMTVCKEIVKQSYMEAGRPDSYREDINQFVSADQFSYAASVDGMISREKPAACFYMGYFMAESLLLAEVGATSGAIQIAGTDVEHQLPFFFTACDYTLIGEELYAAGAYLSKEPMLLSALKVQDFGKLIVMVSVFFGMILVVLGAKLGWTDFVQGLLHLFKGY